MSKAVRISEDNFQKVAKAGTFNDSFDSALSTLLEKLKVNFRLRIDKTH